MCSPSPGARDQNASTHRKEQQQRGWPTLYLFYFNKRTFASFSNRRRGKRELPTFPRAPPHFPQPIQRLSKLPPRPRGWTPEVRSGGPVASLGGGGDPRQSCPLKPREPRGAGTQGGLGSVGAGPGAGSTPLLAAGPGLAGGRHGPGPPPWQCLQPAALLT